MGNIKLTISHSASASQNLTSFRWTYVINGAEYYPLLNIGFEKNGLLQGLLDTRDVYSVGDTTVNISKEQAVDIAMKYLPSYSYEMPDHTFVSDFNITEDKTMTELVAFPIDSFRAQTFTGVLNCI